MVLPTGKGHSSNTTPRPETAGKEAIDESDHTKIKHIRKKKPLAALQDKWQTCVGCGGRCARVRLCRPGTGQRHGAATVPVGGRGSAGCQSSPRDRCPDVSSKDTVNPTSSQRNSKHSYSPFPFQTARSLEHR